MVTLNRFSRPHPDSLPTPTAPASEHCVRFARTSASLLLLAVAWIHLTAAWPQSAHYTSQADEMLYFLAITDSHIGQGIMGSDQDSNNLTWALTELFQTVNPSFLVNCGDLVDATGGGAIPVGQFDKEWNEYHDLITAAGMSPDFYYDLPGNHDNYAEWPMDHYLSSSIQGATEGRLNHRWTRTDAKGNKYLFLGLATNGSDNSFWIDDPGLDDTDKAFAQETFTSNPDTDIAVIMGHHPLSSFKEGEDELVGWFLDQAVSTYIYGHTHDYSMAWDDGTLQVNLRSTAKNDDRQIGLFAFDGLGLSAKVFDVGAWPQVLITTPVDANLGGNNSYDYMIPDSLTQAHVRALAFHPDGVGSVTAWLDGSVEIPMEVIEENVWQGDFDASTLGDDGPHTIKVVASAWGNTNEHQITFYVFHDETPPDPIEPDPEYDDISSGDTDGDVIEQDDWVESDLGESDLIETDSAQEDLASSDLPQTEDLAEPQDVPETPDTLPADLQAKDSQTPEDTQVTEDLSVPDQNPQDDSSTSDVTTSEDAQDDSHHTADASNIGSAKSGKSGGCSSSAASTASAPWPVLLLLALLLTLSRSRQRCQKGLR